MSDVETGEGAVINALQNEASVEKLVTSAPHVIAGGVTSGFWLTVALALRVQPVRSVTVTEYVPTPRLTAGFEVCESDHAYEKGEVPPDTIAVAVPLRSPGHATLVAEALRFIEQTASSMRMLSILREPTPLLMMNFKSVIGNVPVKTEMSLKTLIEPTQISILSTPSPSVVTAGELYVIAVAELFITHVTRCEPVQGPAFPVFELLLLTKSLKANPLLATKSTANLPYVLEFNSGVLEFEKPDPTLNCAALGELPVGPTIVERSKEYRNVCGTGEKSVVREKVPDALPVFVNTSAFVDALNVTALPEVMTAVNCWLPGVALTY